ncbi:hypothetical protein [Streptomyces sp. NPDC018833]|uniref:hypothetical protein n=1 Tax=Streptomyces sp. NPDC018833 TaxID=3365053 RepID=UPI0037A0727D
MTAAIVLLVLGLERATHTGVTRTPGSPGHSPHRAPAEVTFVAVERRGKRGASLQAPHMRRTPELEIPGS